MTKCHMIMDIDKFCLNIERIILNNGMKVILNILNHMNIMRNNKKNMRRE